MKQGIFTEGMLQEYVQHLKFEERAGETIKKYRRDVEEFMRWLSGRTVTKEEVLAWKEELIGGGLSASTVNTKLAALNGFLNLFGWTECRVKSLKIQRQVFRDPAKELTKKEFERLLEAARSLGRERILLAMEAICAAGIRISELRYITVEAVKSGSAQIRLKGKIRHILLPYKLCRKLLKYVKKNKITTGEIFITRNGTSLSRKQIWREMKALCEAAGVEATKVFPHNLRHLFATLFYGACKDIVKLADVLGHSSIETTRIYLISTGREHARWLDRICPIT